MKNLMLLIAVLFSFCLEGMNANPSPGQLLSVYAYSGLKLRMTPSLQGETMTVIPFGQKVKLVSYVEKNAETIEWMTGSWIEVSYDEMQGYIFSGFTSELPIPLENFERSQNDLDLTYPILAWAEYHFDEIDTPDTLETQGLIKMTQYMINGVTLTRTNTKYNFKVSLEMEDKSIEEVYNLLRTMLSSEAERTTFDDHSIFVTGDNGQVERIKIGLDMPIIIKKMPNNVVKATVTAFHHGCDF